VLAITLLGVLPVLMLSVPTTAVATTKNANFDGDWLIKATGEAHLVVTGEDIATGEFGGSLAGPDATLDIVDGEVTGSAYTFTVEIANTVVGVNGAQFTYGGTFSGNTMTITETAIHAWHKGHPVSASSTNPGPYTGTREAFELSGTIIFGCSGASTSCSSGSAPLYGVNVDVDGDSSETTTTDTDGAWSVSVPPGRYTVTPSAPGITFTPDSLELDVTKDENDQDFSGCGASDTSGDDAREPLVKSASASGFTTLTGSYCHNTYVVTIDPKTVVAVVTWTAKAWKCASGKFDAPEPGGDIFTKNIVGGTAAPGDVQKLSNGSFQIRVNDANQKLVMYITVNASLDGGSVSTYGQDYGRDEPIKDEGQQFCQPVDATKLAIPFPQTSI
jgi:hypothetical protein